MAAEVEVETEAGEALCRAELLPVGPALGAGGAGRGDEEEGGEPLMLAGYPRGRMGWLLITSFQGVARLAG